MSDTDKSKIVTLQQVPTVDNGTPDPHIIAMCEELLEQAKSGDLRALAVAKVRQNYAFGLDWTGAQESNHSLGAGVAALFHSYNRTLLETEE